MTQPAYRPKDPPETLQHVYIHIPFCQSKCGYCALYSVAAPAPERINRFLCALKTELKARSFAAGATETLYIGGGTPSLLNLTQWKKLCRTVHSTLKMRNLTEWTVEANPATLSAPLLECWKTAGITRISLGIQSLNDSVLKSCNRQHDRNTAVRALKMILKQKSFAAGVDLIAGLPNDNPVSWQETLEEIVAYHPQHISVYGLNVEHGTPLHTQTQSGKQQMLSDNAMLRRLNPARSLLLQAGYRHYEISNFALPGYACKHNLNCWQGGDYSGFGPGAATRNGKTRSTNMPDVDAYSAALSKGMPPPAQTEKLSDSADIKERLAFRLRMLDGATLPVEHSATSDWPQTLADLRRQGLLIRKGSRWRLSARGRHLADYAISRLL